MAIRTDQRTIDADEEPELLGKGRELFARSRAIDLELAEVLAKIEKSEAYAFEGCASIGEWAHDNGGDSRRSVALCTLGRGFEKEPRLETAVKRDALALDRACAAARVITCPGAVWDGEDWVEKAKHGRLRDFLHDVKLRLEEVRGRGGPMGMVHIPATEETKGKWQRCRDLLSLVLKHKASDGETFRWAIEATLDAHDPLRRKPGARRVGPTEERPEDRYVPSDVVRELLRRSDLLCEVPGCEHPATEKAHVRPHEMGSGREKRDLFGACHNHHTLYDAGLLRIVGWTAEGKPVFKKGKGPPRVEEGATRPPRPTRESRGRPDGAHGASGTKGTHGRARAARNRKPDDTG